ncbi:MAG: type II CRISPR-associated endonuclease Cas1 [Candidatus Magnetominusculus sp. LBB02]|nr:type II CRISPR-associated endonuclease Cas1 [Candidatus Magnetominusculus sp. LBB02]
MIKRTVSIDNPSRLNIEHKQLVITQNNETVGMVPVEDIALLIVENPNVTYTHSCFMSLLENNAAIVLTGKDHYPAGLFLPLQTNSVQTERFKSQIEATEALKKQLWQQIVRKKITNQAKLLESANAATAPLTEIVRKVKSGDSNNLEAYAARYYWKSLFGKRFKRDRFGLYPNNLLNYGYIILRAAAARCLVSSGLLPTLGIHHRNKYNAFCLADDIMEPYRVFIDRKVYELHGAADGAGELEVQDVDDLPDKMSLTKEIKRDLLSLLAADVVLDGDIFPLMTALNRTTASLQRCFAKEQKYIEYPTL